MRGKPVLAALVAAISLTGGVPARAAEGMPQLDFANPLMLAQIVWLVIIFAVLYLLLGRWALPQIESVLAERAASIGADLQAAQAAKAEADKAVAELTAAAREARARAQAEVASATESARATQAMQSAELTAALEQRLVEAEKRIAAARADAMAALHDVAGEAATTLVTRLTGRPPAANDIGAAVTEAIAARG